MDSLVFFTAGKLLYDAPVGFFMTDVEGQYLYVNKYLSELTGLSLEDHLGDGWIHALHPDDRDSVITDWEAASKQGHLFSKEYRYLKPNGEIKWVYTNAKIRVNDDERKLGYIGFVSDITDRKLNEILKNEFISTVSHELRTPLTSIRGALGILASQKSNRLLQQEQKLLDIALKNSNHLSNLINEILDLEKIEAGKMHFNMEHFSLQKFLHTALELNQPYADQYRVIFKLLEPIPELQLYGDQSRLIQVLTNLLSNAAKYSYPDSEVHIYIERLDSMVRIAVQDFGSGVPEEFKPRIFGKFSQADASSTRVKGGTGLGLNISRAIIMGHQGTLDFTSSNQGSIFFFDIPIGIH